MNYYLPTYEECVKICEEKGDLKFYEIKTELDGYPVSMFNYRLVQYGDFFEKDSNGK